MRRIGACTALLILLLGFGVQVLAGDATCPAPAPDAPDRWQGEARWQTLAAEGYRVGTVQVAVENVFDLDDPAENTWYAQFADFLHLKTHPRAIREQLLFKSGDAVNASVIYQSERRLRALPFLRYAEIVPQSCAGHSVDLLVHVKDAWTLKFDLRFAHVGGQNTFDAKIKDVDFLGTGKALGIGHESNPQRSVNLLTYQDPSLFGSYWQLAAAYEDLSDGHIEFFNAGQPFYSDTAPWSLQAGVLNQREDVNFYNQGTLAWSAESDFLQRSFAWSHLLAWSGDTGLRAGLAYVMNDYSYGSAVLQVPGLLPQPPLPARRLVGPALTAELFQDDYASFTDIQEIGRTEDYNLGWLVDAEAGSYSPVFGGDVAAPYYGLSGSWGATLRGESLLLASGAFNARRENGTSRNLLGNLTATLYNQHFGWQTLVAHVQLDWALHPDPENYLYVGGLQGERAYPNYFAIGDRRWQANFEDRVLTPYQLWHSFQLGFVGYADFGQIHQISPAAWSPTLGDVGFGLRMGSLRSAFGNTFYVTIAFPLRHLPGVPGHQIVVGNILNF